MNDGIVSGCFGSCSDSLSALVSTERSEAVIAVASRFKGTFLSVARPALFIDWSRFVRSALGS